MKPAFILKLRELIQNFSLFISAFAKNILCMRGGSRIVGLVLVSRENSNTYTILQSAARKRLHTKDLEICAIIIFYRSFPIEKPEGINNAWLLVRFHSSIYNIVFRP